jgi:hypothetical protein
MRTCMHMYVCMHVCMLCVCEHTKHTHTHTHIYMYMYICVCVYILQQAKNTSYIHTLENILMEKNA